MRLLNEGIMLDIDDAFDLMQEAFARLYERGIDISDNVGFRRYLMVTVRNMAYDYIKRMKLERKKYWEIAIIQELEMDERFFDDVGEFVIEGEVLATLSDAIKELSEQERRLFLRKYRDKATGDDLVREEGMSRYRINLMLEHARRIVRKRMGGLFP